MACCGVWCQNGLSRMYNEDITDLFERARFGTEVVVIR
jgi:lipoprotein-anchoring transpeptidase ErfK/SrfK